MTEASAQKPTKRNALTAWLVPTLCFVAAPPLGNFLGTTAFRMAPTAAILAGVLITFILLRNMLWEIESVTGSKLVPWHYFIPVYGLYWALTAVRSEVAAAKQKAGKGAPRSGLLYLVCLLYALAADLNDLADSQA